MARKWQRPHVGRQPEAEPQQFEFYVGRGQQGRAVGWGGVPRPDQARQHGPAPVGEFRPECGPVVSWELLDPAGEIQGERVAIGDDGEFG